MSAKSVIREALGKVYGKPEATAMNIFKGYDVGTGRDGWHFVPFGRTATHLGKSQAEALEMIEQIAEEKREQIV